MVLARRLWLTAVAVAGALLVSLLAVPSASASTGSSFVSLVNSARASHGLHGYAVSSQLTSVALGQAQRMAAQKRLYHNPSLATQVTGWKYVGENVGYGPDVSTLFQAFMNSTPHRDNILDHDFTQIGVGAVTVSGTTWVSMVFREPLHATSSTTKKSTPQAEAEADHLARHRVARHHRRPRPGEAGTAAGAGARRPRPPPTPRSPASPAWPRRPWRSG